MSQKIDIAEFELNALSEATREAYGEGWNCYCDFLKSNHPQRDPFDLDEQTACEFLVWLCSPKPQGKGLAVSSAMLYRQGVVRKLQEAKVGNPFSSVRVSNVTTGLARKLGVPPRRVKPILADDLVRMIEKCGKTKIGRRDAAVLAIGFSCALRRSEITGLNFEDVKIADDFSLSVLIRKSKTDKAGKGQRVSVPPGSNIRPGATLYKYLAVSGIEAGPLFQTMVKNGKTRGKPLHTSDIPRIVKHYAGLIGLDPREYSGHSLRAGFVTSAAKAGARIEKIMEVTRHVQVQTLLKYIREEDQLSDHAGAAFL